MKDTHSGNTHHDQDYICIVEAVGKQEAKHATIWISYVANNSSVSFYK